MGDAEKNHLSTNELVRRLIIENFSNSSRRKGLTNEVVHLDATRRSPERRTHPHQPHRFSDWTTTTTSPKLSRSTTPKSTIGLTTGTTRESVVPSSKYPASKYSFPLHQDASSYSSSSSAARPFGYGRIHSEARHAESASNCGGYFGASASNRSINRSNCNAIVSRTSLGASSSSWKSCSRMTSVTDVGWSRPSSSSVPGCRKGSCADVVRPPGGSFESLLKPTANTSSELFGSRRTPAGAYDRGLRSTGSLLSTGPPPPPPRSVLFDARTQGKILNSSSNDLFSVCRNASLQLTREAPSTNICTDPDETAKIYPFYGQLVAGRAPPMSPRFDPARRSGECCPAGVGCCVAAWLRPSSGPPGKENASCRRPSAAEDPLCPVDWDRRSSRLQNCYGDMDDVNDDDDEDDDDDSIDSVGESIASLVKISSRCGSLRCDGEPGGQLGSPVLLDAYCLTPENPVSAGFCDGNKGSEEEEEEEGEEAETEVCPWPDEWFPVAPDLQRAVARLALKSLRDGEDVGQDLSRLKDANILPPDFFIPEEEDEDDEGGDLEPGIKVSRSLLKVVAKRLVRRLVLGDSSSCKTEAVKFEDDQDCTDRDKQLKSFVKQLRRELRKMSTSKSSSCSSSSSNSGLNVSANNSVMVRPSSNSPPHPPDLSREGLLLFLRCLVELERRTRSLGGTRGRHSEQQRHSRRRDPNTETGSQMGTGCGNRSSPGNETVLPVGKTRRSSRSEDPTAARPNDSRRRKKTSAIKTRDDDAELSGNESHSSGEKDKNKKRHRKRHQKQGPKNNRSPEPQSSEKQNEAETTKRRSSSPRSHKDHLENPEVGSRPSRRRSQDLSRSPRRSLENLVADVVRGLYSAVRGKLERSVDQGSVDAISMALLRPRKADLDVHELVLTAVIEHIVWLVRHHPRQDQHDDDLEGIVRTLAAEYVDTVITNAVLKIGDGHDESRHS